MKTFKASKELNFEEYVEFQTEMNRLANIKWNGYAKTLKEIGIAYMGAVAVSAKLAHSLEYSKVATYGIYLASSDFSGINVCPKSDMCKENCLSGSGHNRLDRIAKKGGIDRARTIKTRLFFANKEVFMRLVVHEINREMARAKGKGYFFAVRLNCTSDINPTSFILDGKNILEMYPDVQFYDYTKVPNRIDVAEKYSNYDITWSIDGSKENLMVGLEYLEKGGRVAVVYGTENMPTEWYGFKTCNGDSTDYRVTDNAPVAMLKLKKTANNYKDGVFTMPRTEFIILGNCKHVSWSAKEK